VSVSTTEGAGGLSLPVEGKVEEHLELAVFVGKSAQPGLLARVDLEELKDPVVFGPHLHAQQGVLLQAAHEFGFGDVQVSILLAHHNFALVHVLHPCQRE